MSGDGIRRPLLSYVDCSGGPDAYWPWLGQVNRNGYGRFQVGSWAMGTRRRVQAHRCVYEEIVGAIPDGLQLDHLCRNRICCNPRHLEPVTARENQMRGLPALSARTRTHCPLGHLLTSRYVPGRGRRCHKCDYAKLRPVTGSELELGLHIENEGGAYRGRVMAEIVAGAG